MREGRHHGENEKEIDRNEDRVHRLQVKVDQNVLDRDREIEGDDEHPVVRVLDGGERDEFP